MPPVRPKVQEIESLLKPFTFQGLSISGRSGEQHVSQCPFCDKGGKFYVNEKTGQWQCQVCTEKGNVKSFLRKIHEESLKVKCDYKGITEERKLLYTETLKKWGLCKSIISNEWILPGFSFDQNGVLKFQQLYVWRKDQQKGRMRFICQSWTNSDDNIKTSHALFSNGYDANKTEVHLTEGLWDGAAYSEIQNQTDDRNLNVLATPGANVFFESWCRGFSGKKVVVAFHNDHPHEHPKTKKLIQGAGYLGVQRTAKVLVSHASPPEVVRYLKWGDEGHDKDLKNGYDIRDQLSQGKTLDERIEYLGHIEAKYYPIDPAWLEGVEVKKNVNQSPLKCHSWAELEQQWKLAMNWNDGLGHAMPAMIACAASPNLPDDLIWLKVMSPASTGKTELAEALAVSERDVVMASTFTGLHSGARLEDGYDGSLISALRGMCFIIKEGDTLLKMDNREKVWSELRDAYDKNSRTHYKNGVANNYLDWPFSHILCGTPSLHEMDDSELGQRYLNIEIMNRIDPKTESAINRSKLKGLFATLQHDPNDTETENASTHKTKARRMTAGYLEYLKPKMSELIRKVKIRESVAEDIDSYAQFVAYFRARPSKTQKEQTSREMSARLATQIGKLALCLTVTLGKNEVDADIMRRIRKVAIDTGKGATTEIAKVLFESKDDGETTDIVAQSVLCGRSETRDMLQFLRGIEVVEYYRKEGKLGSGTRDKWRLTPIVKNLYSKVMVNKDATR